MTIIPFSKTNSFYRELNSQQNKFVFEKINEFK